MAKKGHRQQVGLQCPTCKQVNYVTQRNRNNTQDKLELSKYCNACMKRTEHKERSKLH